MENATYKKTSNKAMITVICGKCCLEEIMHWSYCQNNVDYI